MDKIRVVNKLKEKRTDFIRRNITKKIQKIINLSVSNDKNT